MRSLQILFIFWLGLIHYILSKKTIFEGLTELDEVEALYQGSTADLDSLENTTYDSNLLDIYFFATSGYLQWVNHTWPVKEFNDTRIQDAYNELTHFPKSKNLNRKAIKYFVYLQSLLVNEIQNPFGDQIPDLSEMNFDFQYHEDTEIKGHQKLNYLSLMEFWKEYIWIYHQKSPKELEQIHEDYMRLLVLLFPSNSKARKQLKPFEWMNNKWKCTVDKMAIFLNPVSKATDYYKSTKGVPPLQPDINDNTETSLEDTYYLKNLKKIPSQETTTNSNSKSTPEDSSSQEEQDSVKKVNEINRNITEENNATAADGANVTTSGKVVVNPLQGEYGPRNLEPGAQPEGRQVIEGRDGLPQDGAEQPVQPGVDGNGAEGNPVDPGVGDGGIGADPMNPVAGNPGIGNGGGLFGGRGLFGGWNPFGFLYSPRVFGNYLNPKIVNNTEDEDEPTHMKFLINDALKSNDPNKFVNIANHYMLGNSEMGLVQNPNKAWKYYEIAAEMNHPAAIHNIAIKGLESNLTYSLEMFERWAKLNFTHCYIGIGIIYSDKEYLNRNLTKAVEAFEKALQMGEYEGAIHLGDLYLQDEEIKNRTEGIRYLELAVEKTDRPYPKLLMVSTYLDDETILQDFKTCKRIYKLMKDINEVGEINAWYYHGYKKYTMGRFDQALQLFSFASMNGHKQATLAAAYIWEHNLTETLTWKLGHHSLWSFIYDMQSFFVNDNYAGLRATRVLESLNNTMNITDGVQIQSQKLAYKMLDYLSPKIPEAKFNKASYIIKNIPEKKDEAFKIWDSMMDDSLDGTISFTNLAPSFISKYYHSFDSLIHPEKY